MPPEGFEGGAPAPATNTTQTSNSGENVATSPDATANSSSKPNALAPGDKSQAPTKEAPKTPPELFEIKVHGKTKRVTREELVRMAQLADSATERCESAAQKERQAQQIIDRAKKNPMEALLDPELGLNKEQIREAMEAWYAKEFIEPETMTKEQLRLRDAEAKLKEFEDQKAEWLKQKQAEQEEQEAKQHLEVFQKQIMDAIDTYKLPRTKQTVKRIAFYMQQNMRKGFEAPMELIVQQVRAERAQEDAEIKDYSYDDWVERFGEDRIKFLISENLKRLREKRAQVSGESFAQPNRETGSSSGKISMSEVNARLRAMRLGK